MTASAKLEQLKLDLALREDNTYVGSGLGGNEKEFLKLLSCQSIISSDIDGGVYLTGDTILFDEEILEKDYIINLRRILSEKLAPVIDSPYVVQNEIIELEKCKSLAKSLVLTAAKRDAFIKAMNELQEQECDTALTFHLHEHFKSKEISTSQVENFCHFQRQKENMDSAYSQDLNKIHKRYNLISKLSITREERNTWKELRKFASYIILFAIRNEFGVDRLAKYDHDEFVTSIANKNK